jgi:hypothetical protein
MNEQAELNKRALAAYASCKDSDLDKKAFTRGFVAALTEPVEVPEPPELPTYLMTRKEVVALGKTLHEIRVAVKEGKLEAYEGPLAKKGALYYSVDVQRWLMEN